MACDPVLQRDDSPLLPSTRWGTSLSYQSPFFFLKPFTGLACFKE